MTDDDGMLYRAAVAGMYAGLPCRYEDALCRHLQRHRLLHVEILYSVASTATTRRLKGIVVPFVALY